MNLFVALFSLAVIYVVSVQKEYVRPYLSAFNNRRRERFFDLTTDGKKKKNFFDGENEFSATQKKANYDRSISPRVRKK